MNNYQNNFILVKNKPKNPSRSEWNLRWVLEIFCKKYYLFCNFFWIFFLVVPVKFDKPQDADLTWQKELIKVKTDADLSSFVRKETVCGGSPRHRSTCKGRKCCRSWFHCHRSQVHIRLYLKEHWLSSEQQKFLLAAYLDRRPRFQAVLGQPLPNILRICILCRQRQCSALFSWVLRTPRTHVRGKLGWQL